MITLLMLIIGVESYKMKMEEKNQEVIEMRQELERLRIQLATLKKEL